MAAPTRYTSGVATGPKGSVLFSYLAPDYTKVAAFWQEFSGLDFDVAKWTVTETDAASTQGLVVSDFAGEYGILRLTQAGTGAAAVNSIQLTTAPIFINDPSKKFWLKGRMSRDNADETMGFGVQAVNATPFTVANGIWVSVTGASTDAVFRLAKASAASTSTATGAYPTSALNTFATYGMYYDGQGREVKCYVNDAQTGVIDISATNNTPIVAITPTLSSQNTTANARNVDWDYFMFAVER